MAWTQSDVDIIEAAIVAAASQGFADITVGNIALRRYSLKELTDLRDKVRGAAVGGNRYSIGSYSKD